MTDQRYRDFRHAAHHDLMALNATCKEKFGIGSYERWDYDGDAGTITFSEGKIPKVVAEVQLVGTTSNEI